MKNSIKTYTNVSWLPENATIDIVLHSDIGDLDIGKNVTVFAFVIDKTQNEIILLKHAIKRRGYDIPGGHVEDSDINSITALKREILEEVGATVTNITPIGVQIISKDKPEDNYPDLIAHQAFYYAELENLDETLKLENDSEGVIKMKIEDWLTYLSSKEEMFLTELVESLILRYL